MDILIKGAPDKDWYVVWSDGVEAPLAFGDRAAVEPYLAERGSLGDGNRFARADATGTSATWGGSRGPAYGWEDPYLIYEQKGLLPRARLPELCARLLADEHADVSDLLDPFEDEP